MTVRNYGQPTVSRVDVSQLDLENGQACAYLAVGVVVELGPVMIMLRNEFLIHLDSEQAQTR